MVDSTISYRLYAKLNDTGRDRLTAILSPDALRDSQTIVNYPANLARTTILGGTATEVASLLRHLSDPELLDLAVRTHKNQVVRLAAAKHAARLHPATRATLLVWLDAKEKAMDNANFETAFQNVIDECSASEILDVYTAHPKALAALSYSASSIVQSRLCTELAESNDAALLMRLTRVCDLIRLIGKPLHRAFAGEFGDLDLDELVAAHPTQVLIAAMSNVKEMPDALAQMVADRDFSLLRGAYRMVSTPRTVEILFASASFNAARLVSAFGTDSTMLRAVLDLPTLDDETVYELAACAATGFPWLDEALCVVLERRLDEGHVNAMVAAAIAEMLTHPRHASLALALRFLDAHLGGHATLAPADAQRALRGLRGLRALAALESSPRSAYLLEDLEAICARHGFIDSFTAEFVEIAPALDAPWFDAWLARAPMRRIPTHQSAYLDLVAARLNEAAGDDPRRWDLVAALLPSWEGTLPDFAAIVAGVDDPA